MKKLTVGILFGGVSTEYEVSLSSASSVIQHINRDQYDVVMIGITRQGRWFRYSGDVEAIKEDCWSDHSGCIPAQLSLDRSMKGLIELVNTEYRFTSLDVVFPVMHGINGEDGTIQGLLQLANIPFIGCDLISSAMCMDKPLSKILAKEAGIHVPPFFIATKEVLDVDIILEAERLDYPLYIKPARSGSSIGISKAYNRDELVAGLNEAWEHDNKIIIESHVEGIELGCAVLGNRDLTIGLIDEISLSGEFFDNTEKYTLSSSTIHMPARISPEKEKEAKEIALCIYRLFGCNGLARIDLFLTPDGTLLFNEVNTLPGFTETSRYPNMMRGAGIGFTELLDRLIQTSLEREGI
ncbi:D-alanine--D-serine ligase VanG [Bacillus sp. AFS055030]|uniref:D-alanine--D-serine ligase VanG n=1 Tax=Bacillus sp. AFS055030 TaxID=2033507 RepID=UPI000BFD75D5|nr:D-alanine--D-serine ligase VanG [Bacillus sp. AFS055030]PGL71013.1 D-alanine--(R)-lactate ligase [Bacillus sp. AFS055030]